MHYVRSGQRNYKQKKLLMQQYTAEAAPAAFKVPFKRELLIASNVNIGMQIER